MEFLQNKGLTSDRIAMNCRNWPAIAAIAEIGMSVGARPQHLRLARIPVTWCLRPMNAVLRVVGGFADAAIASVTRCRGSNDEVREMICYFNPSRTSLHSNR